MSSPYGQSKAIRQAVCGEASLLRGRDQKPVSSLQHEKRKHRKQPSRSETCRRFAHPSDQGQVQPLPARSGQRDPRHVQEGRHRPRGSHGVPRRPTAVNDHRVPRGSPEDRGKGEGSDRSGVVTFARFYSKAAFVRLCYI